MALALALAMVTRVRGLAIVLKMIREGSVRLPSLIGSLRSRTRRGSPARQSFLASDPDIAPAALLHNLTHNRVLHENNFIVHVSLATTPSVPDDERLTTEFITADFTRILWSTAIWSSPV